MVPAGLLAAGGLAVALLPAVVVLVLRRRRAGRIAGPEDAANAADAALSGFRTVGAVLGTDGVAALVVDARDRVAVCRRHGKRLSVDEVPWSAIRATAAGLVIDVGRRTATVAGVDALDVRRLRPQDERSRASASPM